MMDIVVPNMTAPHGVLGSPCTVLRARVTTYLSSLVSTINGVRKLFQKNTNWMIPTVPSTGFISGRAMVKKVRNSPAPSILAASNSSRGIDATTYCLTRKMATGVAVNGSQMAR